MLDHSGFKLQKMSHITKRMLCVVSHTTQQELQLKSLKHTHTKLLALKCQNVDAVLSTATSIIAYTTAECIINHIFSQANVLVPTSNDRKLWPCRIGTILMHNNSGSPRLCV